MHSEYISIKDLEFQIKPSELDKKVWEATYNGRVVATAINKNLLKERILVNSKFWSTHGPRRVKSQFFG